MAKKQKRFEKVYEESNFGAGVTTAVILDRETGVNYMLVTAVGGGSSITPLLGRDGQPVISPLTGSFEG